MPNISARSSARTAKAFRAEVVTELRIRQSAIARGIDQLDLSKKKRLLETERLRLLQDLILHFSSLEFIDG